MTVISILYILNSTLLILHEIESAYEKEWEILKLPGKITGFLLIHIPIVLILFYGLIEIEKLSTAGLILGFITGVGGIVPLLVHKVFVKRSNKFNLLISNVLIYLNTLMGVLLAYVSVTSFF